MCRDSCADAGSDTGSDAGSDAGSGSDSGEVWWDGMDIISVSGCTDNPASGRTEVRERVCACVRHE